MENDFGVRGDHDVATGSVSGEGGVGPRLVPRADRRGHHHRLPSSSSGCAPAAAAL